jgi:hypothetical protein
VDLCGRPSWPPPSRVPVSSLRRVPKRTTAIIGVANNGAANTASTSKGANIGAISWRTGSHHGRTGTTAVDLARVEGGDGVVEGHFGRRFLATTSRSLRSFSFAGLSSSRLTDRPCSDSNARFTVSPTQGQFLDGFAETVGIRLATAHG